MPQEAPVARLAQMDAIEFLRSMPDASVDLVITDPAYESLEKHRAIGTTTRLKHSKASSNDWFAIFPNARPSRFVWNLAESIFWNEKLTEAMAGRRAGQLTLALGAIAATLCGLVLVEPSGLLQQGQVKVTAIVGLKVLGAFVSVLVALDVYGELSAFRRGSRECRDLLGALERWLDPPDRDEGLRIVIEYNCLLADLPMVPDEMHRKLGARLDKLWADASARMRRS